MRHPHPMEQIARMLVDPNFQESLGLPTAEYVKRHNLEERITNALGVAGFTPGQPVPPDMAKRLSQQLLADDAKVPAAAHSEVVKVAVQAAQKKLESTPLPSEGEDGAAADYDLSSAWSCRTWAASLPLGELLIKTLCGPVEDLVKDWPMHTRSAAELEYVRRLFEGISKSQDPESEVAVLLRPALAACTKELVEAGTKLNKLEVRACVISGGISLQPGMGSYATHSHVRADPCRQLTRFRVCPPGD